MNQDRVGIRFDLLHPGFDPGELPIQPGQKVIVNTTRMTVRPENRGELFQTIKPLLEPIRSEKGCLAYDFYVDVNDENSTVLIGEWESQEDWANHLNSRDFAVLLGAITILSSPASIDFKLLSAVADKEQFARLRA